MIGHDDVRKLLRDSDPARGRAMMSPVERARMKAALRDATPRAVRPLAPYLVLGTVTAMAVVAAALLLSPPPRHAPAVVAKPVTAPPSPPMVTEIERRPVAVSRPPRTKRAHARPAILGVTPRTTRIEFTAPEGTRILWFVGSPDEKELGS